MGTGTPLRPRACVVPARYRRSPPDPLAGSRVACSVPRTPQRVPVQAPLRATWCLRVAQGSSHLTCRVSTKPPHPAASWKLVPMSPQSHEPAGGAATPHPRSGP